MCRGVESNAINSLKMCTRLCERTSDPVITIILLSSQGGSMSTKLLGAAVAVVSLVLVPTARAQTKATSASRIRLVRAQCTTGPCAPGFDFKRGDVQLRTVKNPKPVGDRRFGKVSITGLDAGLDPAPATLEAEVTGTRTFGTDPDGDCALESTQTSGVFGTSTMTCNLSDVRPLALSRGSVLPVAAAAGVQRRPADDSGRQDRGLPGRLPRRSPRSASPPTAWPSSASRPTATRGGRAVRSRSAGSPAASEGGQPKHGASGRPRPDAPLPFAAAEPEGGLAQGRVGQP